MAVAAPEASSLVVDLRTYLLDVLGVDGSQITTSRPENDNVQILPLVLLQPMGGSDALDGDMIWRRVFVGAVAESFYEARNWYAWVSDYVAAWRFANNSTVSSDMQQRFAGGLTKPLHGAYTSFRVPNGTLA